MPQPIYRYVKEDLFIRKTDSRPTIPAGKQVLVRKIHGTHPTWGDDYDIEYRGRIYSCYAAWLSVQPVLPDGPLPESALTAGAGPPEKLLVAEATPRRGIYNG